MTRATATQSSEDLLQTIATITTLVDRVITRNNEAAILGVEIVKRLRADGNPLPRMIFIRAALLSDCLRVAKAAVEADGRVTQEEIDLIFPLVFATASTLSRVRSGYLRFAAIDHNHVPGFLEHFEQDASEELRALVGTTFRF